MSNTKTNNGIWARLVTKHSKIIVACFVVLIAIAAWYSQNFRVDASAETLLTKNNQLYIQTQIMDSRFAPQEFILVAYQPKQGDLFSQQTFDDISQLSEEFKQIDRVDETTSILNVPLISMQEGFDPSVNASEWSWQNKHYSPEQMKQVFTDHPIYTDLLVNQQQSATAIQILFKPDPELQKIENQITELQKKHLTDEFTEQDQDKIEKLTQQADPIKTRLQNVRQKEIDQIYEITDKVRQRANIYLGGGQVLAYQLIKIIKNDLLVFGSAIAIVICIMLLLLFRQWRWVVLPVVCCAVSVVITMGLFGMLDMRTTVISSNFIALQLILTLAIVIHLIVQFRQLAEKHRDYSHHQLVAETIHKKIAPCFYAGLTTSVGFASLIFSNIQPVIAFGWMMIVAMLVSTLVSLLLFPALLNLMPLKKVKARSEHVSKGMTALAGFVLSHKALVFVLGSGLLVGSVLGAIKLDVENSFIHYFSDSTKVRKELEFIDQQFGGSTPLDFVYDIQPADNPDLVMTAENVQTLQKIQHVMDQYPVIGKEMSIVNFTQLAKQLNDGKPLTEYELTAVYHLLDKELSEQLLGAYFSPEHQQVRISTRIKDSTEGFNRAEFLQRLRSDIEGLGIAPGSYQLTNLFILYQDILQRLFESQISTLGIVYGVLALVLLIIFRSLKVALIAIVPNIISTMVILGLMGWFGISLDLMTITIAAIAMGIAVDDTIHFVHHYLQSVEQQSKDEAIKATYHSVGFAMLFTSVIITAGFGMLGFSDFIPSVMFGLLTGLAMLIALLTDLTLLPAMLNKFVGARKHTHSDA
ncbi:efflux RND transporter permease subunit [Neptunicella sp. SCSIO 80796]|uniref:efflux RND transporter permease subunit n=1 Tax=Neptunicella plasticusilytica TaxID=3117012 RepID=UPI003A4D6266